MSIFLLNIAMAYSLFKFKFQTLIVVVFLCISNASFSAVVDGLFRSNIEVNSQQASDRETGFNEALVKTLLKVSGQRELVHDRTTQRAFFPAERYVQRFSYKENPRYTAFLEYQKQIAVQEQPSNAEQTSIDSNLDNEINKPVDENSPQVNLDASSIDPSLFDPSLFDPPPLPYLLEVDFAPEALEARMKNFNLPIWGNVRPEVMFWVLIESEGERQLIGSSTPNILTKNLIKASEDYALPFTLPVGDKLDINVLNMSDLWGLFPDAIDQAKLRYTSNGNLMVRIYQSMSNTWSANWYLSINGGAYTGQLHNSSMFAINDEIMSFISGILAKRFVVVSSDLTTIQNVNLDVSNINNFKDYVDIQKFLENLAPIELSSLDSVEGSVMSFSLVLNSTPGQLQEYLGLSGKLQFLSSTTNELFSDHISYEQEKAKIDTLEKEVVTSNTVTEQAVTSRIIRVQKYKWLSETPETIKK
ncbi:MAG: hypothetical protein ACI8O8_003075 [Oleiphilaceae bacterium]|jgi:hypothetical protein